MLKLDGGVVLSGPLCHFTDRSTFKHTRMDFGEVFDNSWLVVRFSGLQKLPTNRKWGIVESASKLSGVIERQQVRKRNQTSTCPFPLCKACFSRRLRPSHLDMTASILMVSVPCCGERVSAMYWLLTSPAAFLVHSSLVQ